jgi:F-type H+-transporting ATPase subunit a
MVVSCRFFGIKPFRFLEATPLPEVSEQPIHGFGMIFHRLLLVIALIAALPFSALFGAEEEAAVESASAGESHGTEAHGNGHADHSVTPKAVELFHIGPLPITNSMIYTWIIMAFIFLMVRMGTRQMSDKPSKMQNFIEAAVEGLESMTAGMLEPKVVRWCFPMVATFFLFIVVSNLMGLLPGVGSITFKGNPIFRPPTADANTTIAMALVFFIMSTYWAVKYNGVGGLIKHIFGVKGGMTGPIVIPLIFIFIFIGLIEVMSILIRPVALAMRLYGNIYGGESVLTLMLHTPPFGLAALPFYFMELLVACVQALVFTILCIAFIGTLCSHTEEEGGH